MATDDDDDEDDDDDDDDDNDDDDDDDNDDGDDGDHAELRVALKILFVQPLPSKLLIVSLQGRNRLLEMTTVWDLGRPRAENSETVVTEKNRNEIHDADFGETSHTDCSVLARDEKFRPPMCPNWAFRVYKLIRT